MASVGAKNYLVDLKIIRVCESGDFLMQNFDIQRRLPERLDESDTL